MLRSSGAGGGSRVTWSTLEGKPATFAPSAHTHDWADITGKPTSFPPAAHTHAWGDVAGKPATYPPSTHTHLWADITDRPTIPAATPLGTAAPKAPGTAAAGTSANASHEDHVHPLPTTTVGMVALPNVTVAGTILLGAVSGPKSHTVACVGAKVGDRLTMNPVNTVPAGYMLGDVRCSAADTLEITIQLPAVIASYSIPIAITALRPAT